MDPLPLPVQDTAQLQSGCTLTSRIVTLDERDGLRTHLIEAFPSTATKVTSLPLIVLLHGFPELAYSWRKVLPRLSTARGGYHVVAPDLRGFGRTVAQHGGDLHAQIQHGDPLAPFHPLNIAEDVRSLVRALGHDSVSMLVGHDFGSVVAGHCVTAYPELFRSVVFMSVPFSGVTPPQAQPPGVSGVKDTSFSAFFRAVSAALATLAPPRKHYTAYYMTPDANKDLLGDDPEDLYQFFGGYYHMKSGAWEGNTTHPLPCASNPSPSPDEVARDLATLPEYYIMPAHENMRQVVARHANQRPHVPFTWPADEADAGWVYASEFTRTGFQGGLNFYRCAFLPPPPERVDQLTALAAQGVRTPAAFVSGARDWGVYQMPGALQKMRLRFGMQDEDVVAIEGAGHWVQQEAPDQVVAALLAFLDKVERAGV